MRRPLIGFGAVPDHDGRVSFRVWAPGAARVELEIEGGDWQTLARGDDGVHGLRVSGIGAGARYRFRLDGGSPMPDPASRRQPDGVHGRSEVVDPRAFAWTDDRWSGIARAELVIYEVHVGTFCHEGTFEGVRRRLRALRDLGVTAIELMPVCEFPGRRSWGYDTAAAWAPSSAYGRPDELRQLVNDAHQLGLAVLLDVVYNHLGPDGAYVAAFGPMFNPTHHTPWGAAINLDGEGSTMVRAFLIENAVHWLTEYRLDGLRLDATFALVDDSPTHFLAELSAHVAQLAGPPRLLVAEDPRRLPRLLQPRADGGYGLDAVWADDFHHVIRRLTTGDRHGYFAPYPPTTDALAATIERGWLPGGEHDAHRLAPDRFVFCIQNHDQIGNRPHGDRLHHAIEPPLYRALSALLLFAPELPLLFMGQEWAASAPFQYFTDHGGELGRLVRAGRREEFRNLPGFDGEIPDPQDEQTFLRSRLDWDERGKADHARILRLYADLLRRRRGLSGPAECEAHPAALVVGRGASRLAVALQRDAALAIRPGEQIVWHTELRAYAADPEPPVVDDGSLRFGVPAAAWLELP